MRSVAAPHPQSLEMVERLLHAGCAIAACTMGTYCECLRCPPSTWPLDAAVVGALIPVAVETQPMEGRRRE